MQDKIEFNSKNFYKYLDFFNLSLEEVINKITTKKTKDKKKQEIEQDLAKGKINWRILQKISDFFKVDIASFFFDEFQEDKFVIEFQKKNPKISFSIVDHAILRYYQAIREDIAIFDDNSFKKAKNSIDDDFKKVAKEYRDKFKLDEFLKAKKQSPDQVFQFLRYKIEEFGVYVFKNNKGDRWQTKGLSANLQGCVFLDEDLPPLILINSDYSHTAQISILLHEFAHYLLGISDIELEENFNKNKVEKWCNNFAYHFMIDKEAEKKENFNIDNLDYLSQKYFISKAIFLVRFKELNIINKQEYNKFFSNYSNKFFSNKKLIRSGNYHNIKRERLSEKFLVLLTNSLEANMISESEFAKYIGVEYHQIDEYFV